MSIAAAKQAFVTAVQEVLADAQLLVKKVDGVWDNITQDAYRAFATKFGHDPVQVTNTQPTKIEQLPVHIQEYVADKVAAATAGAEAEAADVKADVESAGADVETHVDPVVADVEKAVGDVKEETQTPAPDATEKPAEESTGTESDGAPSSTEPPVQKEEASEQTGEQEQSNGEQSGEQAGEHTGEQAAQ